MGWIVLGFVAAALFGWKLAFMPLIVITIIVVLIAVTLWVKTRGAELGEVVGIAAVILGLIGLCIMWIIYGLATGAFLRMWSSSGILR